MTTRVRPYQYYDVAVSICATCHRRVEAKIVFQDERVWMLKRCPTHGPERVLIADDVAEWRRARELFLKPSEMPKRFHTETKHGCPYDCGLCPDHEQHSCLSLVELTDHCNLACPICYAESGPHRTGFRSLEHVVRMLDWVVASEGEPDVVQLSGGEPTLHPDFFAILEAARERPIRHVMVNTNGLVLAKDREFVRRLAEHGPGLEIYLQFDSFEADSLVALRGADLRESRKRALEHLNEFDISTTLVVTLQRGRNEHELGKILEFGLEQPCVRGVTIQPLQQAGRHDGYDAATDRLTLTEVRRQILEQTEIFRPEDLLPVPCHPDCITMGYALKTSEGPIPLTGMVDPQVLIEGARNTISFEREDALKEKLFGLLSTAHSPETGVQSLRDLLCCLPAIAAPAELGYRDLFRVVILRFLDAHDFDLRSVKKSCVHVVHPEDGRMIPLDTYNLFYRGDLERTHLAELRSMHPTYESMSKPDA